MARIRTLKPQLTFDGKLAKLSRHIRYHFILLITIADDEGFFRCEPRLLLGQLYPYDDDIQPIEVATMTDALAEAGFLQLFDTADGPIATIVNWKKHQRIDKPTKSFLAAITREERGPLIDISVHTDTAPRWVYAFRKPSTGAIKIGVSADPTRRLVELSHERHERLEFLGCVRGDYSVEKNVHKRFEAFALGFEWFYPDATLCKWLSEYLTEPLPGSGPRAAEISAKPQETFAKSRETSTPGVQEYRSTGVQESLFGGEAEKPESNNEPAQEGDKLITPEFLAAWTLYPKRYGSNPRHEAFKRWNARIKAGVKAELMTEGVKRYKQFCDATGKTGTEYVMQAARFFGPSKEYENTWEVPGNRNKQLAVSDEPYEVERF